MKNEILSIVIIGLFFSGCVNSLEHTMKSSNKDLMTKNQPYLYVKTKSTDKANFYSQVWIGKKGKSIASNSSVLVNDIFKSFENNCELKRKDLKEIRIVYHNHPYYKEVWIFNDSKSKREDKTSAKTVLLKVIENNGGTDINFIGQCHQEPNQYIFVK